MFAPWASRISFLGQSRDQRASPRSGRLGLPVSCPQAAPAHPCQLSVPVFVCRGRLTGTVGEWKYLNPHNSGSGGKKINKGKSSRATEVKRGQRRVAKREACGPRANRWRKHLSFSIPVVRSRTEGCPARSDSV